MSSPPILERLATIQPRHEPGPDDYERVSALLTEHAVDADDALMLQRAFGFVPTPRLVHRKRNRVTHGTPEAIAWHREHATPLCRPCDRWLYAHEVHGTPQACQAHYRDHTQLCEVCKAWAHKQLMHAYEPSGISCGTSAGYRRHIRLGERICASCRSAEARRETKRKVNAVNEVNAVPAQSEHVDGTSSGVRAHTGAPVRVGEADLAR